MLTQEMTDYLLNKLENSEEGFRQFPYNDATGQRFRSPIGKLTMGIGWNIEDQGCPIEIARYVARYFIKANDELLSKLFTVYNSLDQVRQCVLVDMMFNLGFNKFTKFRRFIGAVENKNWVLAANEMRNSVWHDQLPDRVDDLANSILTGSFHD